MHFLDDLRLAARVLRRTPGATFVIVAVLALGIGANTAAFSVLDGVLFRPLPFPDPDRLVALCETHRTLGGMCIASPANALDWREAQSIAQLGVARDNLVGIREADGSVWSVSGGLATPGFFAALGVRPALGRAFSEEDAGAGRRDVALLTDALWRDRFAGDPGVLGRRIVLDGVPTEIVGVLPAGLQVPDLENVRIWRVPPFDPTAEDVRDWRGFRVFARLAPGATIEHAVADLAAVQARLVATWPAINEGYGVRALPLRELIVRDARPTLLLFGGAVGLLLLIACANIAHLLLAQATARRPEFLVRTALGARPRDLARQLLAQSLLLALLGTAAALVLGAWARDLFVAWAPPGIPRLAEIRMDGRVAAFTGLIGLATTALFGLAPLGLARGTDLAAGLRGRDGGRGAGRARRTLVTAEVALTLMLLVGAGLLGRSLVSMLTWDPGFPTQDLAVFQVFAPLDRYPDEAAVVALWQEARAAVASVPGVRSVGNASSGPVLGGGDGEAEFTRSDEPSAAAALAWFDVGGDWFETLGLPLVRGRAFRPTDRAGAPLVAILNETAARRLFGNEDPIGRSVTSGAFAFTREVVGVVSDVPPLDRGPVPAEIYWPQAQEPRWATYFLVRTDVPPVSLARAVSDRLSTLDPELQVLRFSPWRDLVGRRLVVPRFSVLLVGGFALLALLLAATGTYGVVSYGVALRTREIGIRMALGQGPSSIVRGVVLDGLRMIGAGIAIGAVGALLLARTLRGLLHGIAPSDPVTYAATALVLIVVGLMACLVPALRAAGTDPLASLRG